MEGARTARGVHGPQRLTRLRNQAGALGIRRVSTGPAGVGTAPGQTDGLPKQVRLESRMHSRKLGRHVRN